MLRALVIRSSGPTRTSPQGFFARNKDSLSGAQSLLTIGVILLAGIWFVGQHAGSHRLKLEERLSSRLAVWEGKPVPLLWIEVWATNSGLTPVELGPSRLAIDDINPNQRSIYRVAIGDFGIYKEGDILDAKDAPLKSNVFNLDNQPMLLRLRSRAPVSWFWPPVHTIDTIDSGETDEVFFGHYFMFPDTRTVQVTADLQSLDGTWWRVSAVCDVAAGNNQTQTSSCARTTT